MATLHVRNVPDSLYEVLRRRAGANGRSIGAEAIQLLERALVTEPSRGPRLLFGARRRSGPGFLSRFSERGRAAVVQAQESARALGHGSVGTGHLLLALLRVEDGVAAAALESLGLDEAAVRGELERRLPRSEEPPQGQIPFVPEAKKALELALRESLALRHDSIGTEHLLLGIVGEGASLGAELVRSVEPDPERVRACVLRALRAGAATMPWPPPGVELAERPPSFRVVELAGDAAAWERRLNEAAAEGYELVEIRDGRAIFRRP